MKRFVQGDNRTQSFLLPEALDDYVTDTNPVRVVDVFVDELDLQKLGFEGVEPALTGRPSYHPEVMLKIYIYGYLNRIQSSRRLEREAQRNIELMWLTGRLAPDFKTIARFRKDNGKAIRSVCRQFVMLCQRLDLFSEALVAIDGSKFKAVNHRDRNFTSAKLERRMRDIEASISRYLVQMDTADRQEPTIAKAKTERLQDKIAALKEQMQILKQVEVQLDAAPDKQVSLTDPDARSMKTRGTGVVGYNVQVAVDAKHHLIVTHEVTNNGIDRDQLTSMAKLARTEMGVDKLTAVADKGYYKSEEITVASNKNQHFVPRCYFKPFTKDREGLAINLLNVDRLRSIRHASTKNQCSGDYFYGEDLVIERSLMWYEGAYSSTVGLIHEPGHRLVDKERFGLRDFWRLQYLRTEAASRRAIEIAEGLHTMAGTESFAQSIRDAVQQAMRIFLETAGLIDDLKVCLIRNRSNIQFVTSDDPAVFTNRLHVQGRQGFGVAPGLGSAGALLLLPLSPTVLLMCYDGDVYSVAHSNGWVNADNESDIRAFNLHQFLNCRANVYFESWDSRQQVEDDFAASRGSRLVKTHRISYAIFHRETDGGRAYRVVNKMDAPHHREAVVHVESLFAKPTSWPSQIRWRTGGAFAYSDGSAAGYLRRALSHKLAQGAEKIRVW